VISPGNLIIGIIAGAFGLSYFIYGKKQGEMIFMLTGIALLSYPYFFNGIVILIILGLILLPLPFVLKK
jgi:hypothetical protein